MLYNTIKQKGVYNMSRIEKQMQERLDQYLSAERQQLVIKANALVQKTKYALTAQEQKIILYIISKVKPLDTEFTTVSIDIKNLCDICGIEYNSKNYINFFSSIKSLADKSFWLEKGSKKQVLFRWFQKVEIDEKTLIANITLNDELKPYLLHLSGNTTRYTLKTILAMRSKYGIRIYELCKSHAYKGRFEIDLDKLKEMLEIKDTYDNYKNFRIRVLEPAIEEINAFSELIVQFKPIRTVRTITALAFEISHKTPLELLEIDRNIDIELSKGNSFTAASGTIIE